MDAEKILGQNHIIKHFENAIRMGKVSHAYIINGEDGSGKMKLATRFAKSLQCEKNDPLLENMSGEPCNNCKSCHQTDSKNQPDIKYVLHEKSSIGVDDIREQLNDDIEIKPYSSRYKIYIIAESEKMTIQAQNALLKTIEEPPEYGIIILLTNNADMFLPTILSRCVLLNIRPVGEDRIKKMLTSELGVSAYEAEVAATFANGNPGKATKLATSEDFIQLKNHVVETMTMIGGNGMDFVSKKVKEAGEYKKEMNDYFNLMRIWFRDILIYKATKNRDEIIFKDNFNSIEKVSERCNYQGINEIFGEIDKSERRLDINVNFDITMEVLFLTIKERTGQK